MTLCWLEPIMMLPLQPDEQLEEVTNWQPGNGDERERNSKVQCLQQTNKSNSIVCSPDIFPAVAIPIHILVVSAEILIFIGTGEILVWTRCRLEKKYTAQNVQGSRFSKPYVYKYIVFI